MSIFRRFAGAGLIRRGRDILSLLGGYDPFNSIENLYYGWRADKGITLGTGNEVDVWTDQVSGQAATPAVTSPDLVSASPLINNQPYIDYPNGADGHQFTDGTAIQNLFGGSSAFSILCVIPEGGFDNNYHLMWTDNPATPVHQGFLYTRGTPTKMRLYIADGTATIFEPGFVITSDPGVMAVSYDGAGTARFFYNGTFETVTGTHRSLAGLTNLAIGTNSVATIRCAGLADMFVSSAAVDDANIADYYEYFLERYT